VDAGHVGDVGDGRGARADRGDGGPPAREDAPSAGAEAGALPRRVRQASLAPQLRQSPEQAPEDRSDPADRDADEVRSRMASLQRGWQRGRKENAAGDDPPGGTAPSAPRGTTKGDGR
ncbi:histidine kinase, partial [Streptomyces tendae]